MDQNDAAAMVLTDGHTDRLDPAEDDDDPDSLLLKHEKDSSAANSSDNDNDNDNNYDNDETINAKDGSHEATKSNRSRSQSSSRKDANKDPPQQPQQPSKSTLLAIARSNPSSKKKHKPQFSPHQTLRESYKGSIFLVLEYVSHDLTGLLDMAYKFTPIQIKSLFKQLLDVLDFMHRRGYVHRDIKSSNILVDEWGRVKLADFGLARNLWRADGLGSSGGGSGIGGGASSSWDSHYFTE